MLTKVEVDNKRGGLLVLPLQNVRDGFVIKDIDGLDPVKATIVTTGFAQLDGEQYQSSKLGTRNIVLKVGLEAALYAAGTVRDLRNRLYQYFMPKTFVRLQFFDNESTMVEIEGYIESFDSKLFVKEPEATISIMCLKSEFIDPIVKTIEGSTVTNTSTRDIEYEGTVPTGVSFTLEVDRALTAFSIHNTPYSGVTTSMDFTGAFVSGDVISVVTQPGAKSVELVRGGVRSPHLHALSAYSGWINLEPGLNQFRVTATGNPLAYQMSYTDKYGGL